VPPERLAALVRRLGADRTESSAFPALQLKREWSPWPEFGSNRGNPRELSKGSFATTFLSSNLTAQPASQASVVYRPCL
jgi:hypothetical protein